MQTNGCLGFPRFLQLSRNRTHPKKPNYFGVQDAMFTVSDDAQLGRRSSKVDAQAPPSSNEAIGNGQPTISATECHCEFRNF
jgi:hypothetical protein